MSNFPSQLDDDVTLPPVNDNITETGAEAINACRDALFAIETEIGLGASGSAGSIAARLGVSLDPAGAIKPSAIAAMGLVTLPIFNSHIADNAQIIEAKLKLDFRTQDLFNYITDLARDVNESIGWIDVTGIKLDPHIFGALYRHQLSDIDVSSNTDFYLKNKFTALRDNTNSYTLINDINSDLIQHQKADGSLTSFQNVTTFNGSIYPSNYAHLADGIFLNTSRFSVIPQTAQSVQDFAEFIDSNSIFLYGTRIQNLYSNGISRISRSSSLTHDGYGQEIIPPTTVTTYLLNTGLSSSPVDNIDTGDDIIEFKPGADVLSSNLFDSQFALIKPGDIIKVNYGGIEVSFLIKEKKYIQNSGSKKFVIRINGKNLFYNAAATARVDRPLFNTEKYGVCTVAAANNEFAELPSLIVSSPRAASTLGIGFNPQLLDSTHYILYLALFPTGHPADGYIILPGIDVTGNLGTTPGTYTLNSVVQATNNAFRKKGFNYRFVAFQYNGEFGIMLADSYNNAAFQIINGVVNSSGTFEENATNVYFPNNVVGVFGVNAKQPPDPLGFGTNGSGIASPPYLGNYPSVESSLFTTKLIVPLKRNNYYINGIEKEKLNIDVGQALDGYGDGYWLAEVVERVVFPGNRVKVTYRILQDLKTSKLKSGKTLVIQSNGSGTIVDYGRFIIEAVSFNTCPGISNTDITVYDAIHSTGLSPFDSLGTENFVKIYFSSDSVAFNIETATDLIAAPQSFKKFFEVFIDQNGDTFTHERARFNINGSNTTINGVTFYGSSQLIPFNIIKVSPKLRGYKFYSGTTSINKINLNIISFSATTGVYDGYLATWDGINFTRLGPRTTGRIGEVVRFYDESNIDYIDFLFEFNVAGSFTNKNTDIQLFPSLQLDEEIFPIGTCQLNSVTSTVDYIRDIREFGNVSEKQLTDSAINFLLSGDRLLHENGVIKGFDITDDTGNPIRDQIRLSGGVALVNGNIININNTVTSVPVIKEKDVNSSAEENITWALCVNDNNELQIIPLLDAGISTTERIFLVKNPVTGGTYNIDAMFFSDIVNKRKDLCILYIINSGVSGSGLSTTSTLIISDARKYVNDEGSNLPLKFTTGDAQGNFKNITSILNWVTFNNKYNNRIFLKGINNTVTSSTTLSFPNMVYFEGDGGATLTFTGSLTIGSNITFRGLNINISNISISNGSSNIIFENCNIVHTVPTGGISAWTLNGTNIIFKNTSLTINYTTAPTLPDFPVIFITGAPKLRMEDTNITVNFPAPLGLEGNIFQILQSPGVEFLRCTFNGNYKRLFTLSDPGTSNVNLKIKECTITTTHVATSDANWVSSDLVNGSTGIMDFGMFGRLFSDILIEKCTFNFSPASASSNRWPFITFRFTQGSNDCVLKNVVIRECQFNNTSTNEDKRAVIAIIDENGPNISSSAQPALSNVIITNNNCNRNQMIIITSKETGDTMNYPGLNATNCVISNNICGAIGYYVSSGTRLTESTSATIYDKGSGLKIYGNDCHYIANLNYKGKYFVLSKAPSTNYSEYTSGHVKIYNNTTNWIHVGCAYEENSSLTIIDNSLNAYLQSYLDDYDDNEIYLATVSYTIPINKYAIVITSNSLFGGVPVIPGSGNDSNVIISGNTTSTGLYVNSSFANVTYEYGGYIYSQSSAQIYNNILKGLAQNVVSVTGSIGIVVAGPNSNITSNKIYRGEKSVYAYIYAENVNTTGIITHNYFDKTTTNGTEEDLSKNLPDSFIYEKNKNQTVYQAIPLGTNGAPISGGATIFSSSVAWSHGGPVASNQNPSAIDRWYLLHDGTPTSSGIAFEAQITLNSFLPTSVKILHVIIGMSLDNNQMATDLNTNNFKMSIGKTKSTKIDPSSVATLLNSLADVENQKNDFSYGQSTPNPILPTASFTISNATDVADFTVATKYLSIDTSSVDLHTGKNYNVNVKFEVSIWVKGTGGQVVVMRSPLIVKYRW